MSTLAIRLPPWRRVLQIALGFGLAFSLLAWGLPYFAKTTWDDVFDVLGSIPLSTALILQLLMLLGLWMYTFTLTGSLPGLGHTRALIVNVCGSSVGNLLPGGGAAGVAATYTICRSWGFGRRDISTSAIITGVWNTLARMTLPLVAIVGLYVGSSDLPRAATDAAYAAITGGLLLLSGFVAVLASERAAQAIGRLLDKVLRPLWRRTVRGRHELSVSALVTDVRARIIDVARNGWLSMTYGMIGFFGIYYVLFWFLMNSVGVHMRFGTMFAAYAIGRLLTAVGVTPGGLGVTETGTAAVLVGWGAHPAQATAGVVLFTIFTHLMEVPLGALGWLVWSVSRKSPSAEEDEGPAPTPTGPVRPAEPAEPAGVSRRGGAPGGPGPGPPPSRRE